MAGIGGGNIAQARLGSEIARYGRLARMNAV